MIRNILEANRVTSDFSERQNAEVIATKPSRSAARGASNFARQNFLRQLRTTHLRNGGDDPRRPKSLMACSEPRLAKMNPLLPIACDQGGEDRAALADVVSPACSNLQNVGEQIVAIDESSCSQGGGAPGSG